MVKKTEEGLASLNGTKREADDPAQGSVPKRVKEARPLSFGQAPSKDSVLLPPKKRSAEKANLDSPKDSDEEEDSGAVDAFSYSVN